MGWWYGWQKFNEDGMACHHVMSHTKPCIPTGTPRGDGSVVLTGPHQVLKPEA
jgi:hypothetical protein